MPELFIGLISGTSMDGIDAVLVDFEPDVPRLLASRCTAYPEPLRTRLLALAAPDWRGNLDELASLDLAVGEHLAEAAISLLTECNVLSSQVYAIGSHGQTVRHRPQAERPFTVQIGDPNRIAERTGITTVADFRRRDMAAGGEGAPLVPAFHTAVLADENEKRAVLNLGGIANLTLIPSRDVRLVTGFDVGPANTLLDRWAERHLGQPRDEGGSWAQRGHESPALLQALLSDPYFRLPPPKSTGPEYFNLAWLTAKAGAIMDTLTPKDVQATLVALTAESVAAAVTESVDTLLVCGGGVHNKSLMARLENALPDHKVVSTAALNLDPDWVEAMAFAWLARETLAARPGNLPAVTGAHGPRILGAIYPA